MPKKIRKKSHSLVIGVIPPYEKKGGRYFCFCPLGIVTNMHEKELLQKKIEEKIKMFEMPD